jgi:hypothetical protein
MATSLTFTAAPFVSASFLLSSSQATPIHIAKGDTNGARIYGIAVQTNSTTAPVMVLSYSSSLGLYRISALSVTANSGYTAGTATFDYFGNAVAAGLFQKQKDANGVPYFNLPSNASLTMNTSASVFISSGATASIFVMGELY